MKPVSDVLVMGHYCHDTLIHSGGRRTEALGGSSAYISSILHGLGVRHQVIAKVGRDFRYHSKVDHPPMVVEHALTTHFIADFTHGERTLELAEVCESIDPTDIKATSRVALACGLHGEILPATLDLLTRSTEYALADVQGLIRGNSVKGEVKHTHLSATEFMDLLPQIFLIKASVSEAESMDLDSVRQKTRVMITQGSKGCTLLEGNRSYQFPSVPVTEVDPTGAGDCFMAGFAYGLLKKMSIEDCAIFANLCGAQAVRQVGVPTARSLLQLEAGSALGSLV